MSATSLLGSLAAIGLAYLIGSLSFAVIVSRGFGLADPRSYGSKNPGATNVLRSGHRAAAILTLLLDALKGFAPVWLALLLSPRFGFSETTIAFVGLAAFLGHLWPVFFRFAGGKGVATAAGVMFGFSLWLGLGVLAVWIGVVWFFRYSSLGAIAAAITAPIIALATLGSGDFLTAVFCIALLLFWRHSDNLQRIRAGTEPKIGGKKNATS